MKNYQTDDTKNLTEIYRHIVNSSNRGNKLLAVLVDPDKVEGEEDLLQLIYYCNKGMVDYVFVGGSLVANNHTSLVTKVLKSSTKVPVILFPGSVYQIDEHADAILFLCLISGRNPEYLIGQQVLAAPILKRTNLEIIPTSYILVGDCMDTSVAYMSNTRPIPFNKTPIALATSLAGKMMGHKLTYLEAGSGAREHVPVQMITEIKNEIDGPLIVGGGINSAKKALDIFSAGADLIVIGNSFENNSKIVEEIQKKLSAIKVGA